MGTTTWIISAVEFSVAPAEGRASNEEISRDDVCRYSVSGWESRLELRFEEIMCAGSRDTMTSREDCV
jgi:hypothetical protein